MTSSNKFGSIDVEAAVAFKFRPEVTFDHKAEFVKHLKQLKHLDCVQDHKLIVGGPTITEPVERSKGFDFVLLSYHKDIEALRTYQASKEHHWYVFRDERVFDVG